MYMRLWWKDARQFWTIWVFVALAAAAGQWAALNYYGPGVRQGPLLVMALAWTTFYAVAAGAAAFAGERETGTLRLLDILPVARPVVWAGKVSFALVTTLALAAVLFTLAATGTEHWDRFGSTEPLSPLAGVCGGLIALVALSWGLFWSSFLRNALTTAVAAVGFTAISMIVVLLSFDRIYQGLDPSGFVTFEIVVILATLVASNVFFTRNARRRRLPFQFQSPIVMIPAEPRPTGRVSLPLPLRSPVARTLVSSSVEATTADQSPRRSRLAEARALTWETIREGGTTWCLLAVIGLAVPLPFYLTFNSLDPGFLIPLDIIVALVAGINVFGMENRARTQRFLTHHGARPGLVWLVKLTIWSVGVAVIWGPPIMVQQVNWDVSDVALAAWLGAILMVPLAFSVALLCGMTISRGLTAAVIAMVMTLALAIPLNALVRAALLPAWGLLAVPVALLVVSWAWSGDWLLDRPAPGRWLRLGSLLTGTFAVLFAFYTGFRAWSVPDVGPIAPPRAWIAPQPDLLRADIDMRNRDTDAIHRQVVQSLKSRYPGLDLNDEALGLVRRAVAQPDSFGKELLDELARLAITDARNRLAHGELAAAWSDLINVFRMVRHRSDGAGIAPAMNALMTERKALDLAMEWAVALRQTPEQLRVALAAIRDLPKMTPADEVFRAEANLTERMIDLPVEKLERELGSLNAPGRVRTGEIGTAAWLDWLTAPWERTRARRVNRLLAMKAIDKATLEPWQRRGTPSRSLEADISSELASTPLAKRLVANTNPYLGSNDWNEVGRRALVQVLAVRAWQLRHNGQFPDSLEKLVPEELPSLPIDPYAGRTFRYVRSVGLPRVPLGEVLGSFGAAKKVQTKGYWLLCSDERDNHDDDDAALSTTGTIRGTQTFDAIFPIPPAEGGGGVDKKR